MKISLEHAAIWTNDLENLRDYYMKFFNARSNNRYHNLQKNFQSYFLSFDSGARLEIMKKPGIPANLNDPAGMQHMGLIHLAFGVDSINEVDAKANEIRAAGYPILSGPRKTGDGYYEFETLDPDGNRIEVTTVWREGGNSQ